MSWASLVFDIDAPLSETTPPLAAADTIPWYVSPTFFWIIGSLGALGITISVFVGFRDANPALKVVVYKRKPTK